MKKFEVGKVYEQMQRDGTPRATFTPLYTTDESAFGVWTTGPKYTVEVVVSHKDLSHTLTESSQVRYREKPSEPKSIDIYVNVYKKRDGSLDIGNANKKETPVTRDIGMKFIGVAHIKFIEPTRSN